MWYVNDSIFSRTWISFPGWGPDLQCCMRNKHLHREKRTEHLSNQSSHHDNPGRQGVYKSVTLFNTSVFWIVKPVPIQWNLDNWTPFGRAKIGQISKVVTLSRWSGHILWPSGGRCYGYQGIEWLNLALLTKRMLWLANLAMVWISNKTMVWFGNLQLIGLNLTCLKIDQICDISANLLFLKGGQISKLAFGLIIKVAND